MAAKHLWITLTSRCNTKCRHCMYSCEPGKGEDMTLDNLRKVLAYVKEHKMSHIIVTGGEPTIHAEFEEAMKLIIASGAESISIYTNGKDRDRALRLRQYTDLVYHYTPSKGVQQVTPIIVLTPYQIHNVDPEVLNIYERDSSLILNDCSAVSVTIAPYSIVPQGRAKGFGKLHSCLTIDGAVAADVHGRIRACPCPQAPVITGPPIYHCVVMGWTEENYKQKWEAEYKRCTEIVAEIDSTQCSAHIPT